jgi:hypothetical protein
MSFPPFLGLSSTYLIFFFALGFLWRLGFFGGGAVVSPIGVFTVIIRPAFLVPR